MGKIIIDEYESKVLMSSNTVPPSLQLKDSSGGEYFLRRGEIQIACFAGTDGLSDSL